VGERWRREKIKALKLSELWKITSKKRERKVLIRDFKEELTERERKWKWMKKEVQDNCRLVQMAFRKLLLVSFKTKSLGPFLCAFEDIKSMFLTP
jgi:hypothetical protein